MSTYFSVDPEALKLDADRLNEIGNSMGTLAGNLVEVENDLRFDFSKYAGVINALQTCTTNTRTIQRQIFRCGSVCRQSAIKYENTENDIILYMDSELFAFIADFWGNFTNFIMNFQPIIGIPGLPFIPPIVLPSVGEIGHGLDYLIHWLLPYDDSENGKLSLSGWGGSSGPIDLFGLGTMEGAYHLFHLTSETDNRTGYNPENGTWGIGGTNTTRFSVADAEGSIDTEYFDADGTVRVGTGVVTGGAGVVLGPDGQAGVYAEGDAKIAAAEGEVSATLGTENYNQHGSANGTLVGAEAKGRLEAGTIVTDDGDVVQGVSFEAGAEAYMATGELTGGYTFMGIDFDVTVGGTAGGVGGTVGGEVTTGSVEGEIGAALGLGLDLKVRVDWTDFELPEISWPW